MCTLGLMWAYIDTAWLFVTRRYNKCPYTLLSRFPITSGLGGGAYYASTKHLSQL